MDGTSNPQFLFIKKGVSHSDMGTWTDAVRSRRKRLGLTQVQVARRLGVTPHHFSQIESGRTNPSASLQMEIDRLLKNWNDEPELTLMFDYMRVRFPTHDAKAPRP
ncbi:helix-turn-helix transcriptional regulator [Liquorilactobacillus nagelii DSM 13675]|nr:helix-turn-helix transcriptional regulator [Liquorilactobacillus nagelii]QYH53206.1 helix-turn-helix transcriptional regulator [Liquorilactobacillus nagelii DSM 13675]